MIINYVSDLHIEFERPIILTGSWDSSLSFDNNSNADVLVLAGDINTRTNVEWVDRVRKSYKDVIYIMGNHELYRGHIFYTFDKIKEYFKGTNVHVLENSSVSIEGVWFHGTTLWTSCGDYEPAIIRLVDNSLNDFRLIRNGKDHHRLTAAFSTTLYKENIGWLEAVVKEGDVVVTHHAPSWQSVHETYKDQSDLNCAYVSDLEWLIKKTKPSVWIHGHVHNTFDYRVGDTNVLCNPRGYVNYHQQDENPVFDRNKTVEV